MEIRNPKFKDLAKLSTGFVFSLRSQQVDVSQSYDLPIPSTQVGTLNLLSFKDGKKLSSVQDAISSVHEEIVSNLEMHIAQEKIRKYLLEVYTFYSEIEEKLLLYENDDYSSDFITFKDTSFINLDKMNKDIFRDWLKDLISTLRNEMTYIQNHLMVMDSKTKEPISNNPVPSDISWKRDKAELIMLGIALHKIGAINNSSRNLDLNEAVNFFCKIFGYKTGNFHSNVNDYIFNKRLDKIISLFIDLTEEFKIYLEENLNYTDPRKT